LSVLMPYVFLIKVMKLSVTFFGIGSKVLAMKKTLISSTPKSGIVRQVADRA
jgi:hypothetical protein